VSASVEELRSNVRQRASQKRTVAFENFNKQAKPPNLAVVLSELTAVLKGLQEMLAERQIDKAGPVKFKVTERDFAGNVTLFEAERQ